MTYDIFQNDKEKADARQALTGLIKHPGWPFILRALQANVDYLAQELRQRKFVSVEELVYFQDRMNDIEAFQSLPENILHELQPTEEEEDADIYPDK